MLLNIGNNLGKKLTIKNPNPIFIVGLLNNTGHTLHPSSTVRKKRQSYPLALLQINDVEFLQRCCKIGTYRRSLPCKLRLNRLFALKHQDQW